MIDWSTIIVAAIALVGTLAGSYFGNSKAMALFGYRLDRLEEKQNKHNNFIERLTILEQSQKAAWQRIDDVKREVEEIERKI